MVIVQGSREEVLTNIVLKHTYTHAHTCTRTHTYTHTQTHTHTYTHTYTHSMHMYIYTDVTNKSSFKISSRRWPQAGASILNL